MSVNHVCSRFRHLYLALKQEKNRGRNRHKIRSIGICFDSSCVYKYVSNVYPLKVVGRTHKTCV